MRGVAVGPRRHPSFNSDHRERPCAMNHLLEPSSSITGWRSSSSTFLLQAGLPVPAYPTLIMTGALARAAAIRCPRCSRSAVVASLIADLTWYREGGGSAAAVLKTICRVSLSPDSCVRQTESIFTRWGAQLAGCREVHPGIRVGRHGDGRRLRVPLWSFILFDAIGAAAVVGRGDRSWATCSAARSTMCSNALRDAGQSRARAHRLALRAVHRGRSGGSASASSGSCAWTASPWTNCASSSMRRKVGKVIDVRSPMSQAMTGPHSGRDHGGSAEHASVDLLAVEPRKRSDRLLRVPERDTAAKVAKALVQHGFKRVRPLLGRHRRVDRRRPRCRDGTRTPVARVLKCAVAKFERTRHDQETRSTRPTRPPRSAPTRRPSAPATRSIFQGNRSRSSHDDARRRHRGAGAPGIQEPARGRHRRGRHARRHGQAVDPDARTSPISPRSTKSWRAISSSRIRRARRTRWRRCRAAR